MEKQTSDILQSQLTGFDFRLKNFAKTAKSERGGRNKTKKPSRPFQGANTSNKRFLTAVHQKEIKEVEYFLNSGIDYNCQDGRERTALHLAANGGNIKLVRLLLDHGADPNIPDCLGNSPLHLLAWSDRIDIMTILLEAGANPSIKDKSGRLPINYAWSRLNRIEKTGSSKEQYAEVLKMLEVYMGKVGDEDDIKAINEISKKMENVTTEELTSLLDDFRLISMEKMGSGY